MLLIPSLLVHGGLSLSLSDIRCCSVHRARSEVISVALDEKEPCVLGNGETRGHSSC